MYCVKCGVRLADTEKVCPLCGTRVYHPDLQQAETTPLYPNYKPEKKKAKRWSIMLVLTILYLLPISVCLTADLSVNGILGWSGYVAGSLLVLYTAALLPLWFEHPNPVIFVPITFGVIAGFLLYICYATGGNWFLSFAFPVTGATGLLVTAVVTLHRYILRGRLYIYGGAVIGFGLLAVLVEFLLTITFTMPPLFTWSLYPLTVFTLLGSALLATAVFRPLREALEKKLFI